MKKNMSFIILVIFLFGVVLLFGWQMLRWQYSKADKMLNEWAEKQGITILEKIDANEGDGPMGRRGSATYVRYKIKVKDSSDSIKTGVITLGNPNTGVLSDEVTINWDN